MSVLVTGGTGFIGQHLVRALRRKGLLVRVLVRSELACRKAGALGAQPVFGDVRDLDLLRDVLRGVTTVFHLAGRLHTPGVTLEEYQRLHVDGTRNMLLACAEIGSINTIVHCSTTGVLGPTGRVPEEEDAPFAPDTTYEQSKAQAELVARDFASRYGLPVSIARPSLVYGPGDLHLLGWFRAIQGGYYRLVGPGDNLLHPIYVSDLVEGLLRCAEAPHARWRVYHLVGPEPVTIAELARLIAQALGKHLPRRRLPVPIALGVAMVLEAIPGIPSERLLLTRSRVAFMTESRVYSGRRARDELGFRPKVELETGLRQTVAWYRREGFL